ncbi:caspase domain-containing protein [Streptomyces sp. CAI-85]|uniref:caspase family protein n=1 Tax=Streptomyces sp. CAI-85 TaxID=1472662 RepID=UPI001587F347|nr:caspase family protein [Streptomyces sp. CAI-85]NUV58811.1 caspase family protein [Streptomyces sp. CAI-85]
MTERRALLIGCSRYEDRSFAELAAPFHDLAELSTVLSRPDIGGYSVQRMFDATATEAQLAVSKLLKEARRTDVLFVHFSCHGWLDDMFRLYLVLRDSRSDHIEASGFSVGLIAELLESCASEQIVLSIDCCYSGRAKRVLTARGPSSVGLGARLQDAGSGFAVLTSADEVQLAMEASGKFRRVGAPRTSLYVTALVDGLRTGDADLDRDGVVSLPDLAEYLRQRFTGQAQQPTASLFLKRPVTVALSPRRQQPGTAAGGTITPASEEEICRVLRSAPLALGLVVGPPDDDPALPHLRKSMPGVIGEKILGYRDRGHSWTLLNNAIPLWRSHNGYLVFTDSAVHLPKRGGRLTYKELADHEITAESDWAPGHPRQGGSYSYSYVLLKHPYRSLTLGAGNSDEHAERLAGLLNSLAGLRP